MENGRKEEHDITWKGQKAGNVEGVEYIYRPKFVLWNQALMAFPAFTYTHYSTGQMHKWNEYKTINKPPQYVNE